MLRTLCFAALGFASTLHAITPQELASRLIAPAGWKVELYASPLPQARALALGPDGTLYVGSKSDSVFAFKDGRVHVLAQGLSSPIGLDMKDGDLYVSSVDRIMVLRGIASRLATPPKPELFADLGTPEGWHGGKVIRFGPDGKLYVPVGMPCNVCEKPAPYGRFNVLENGKLRPVAQGMRNSVGFDWRPGTKELWFTDNGRDMMGDDTPPCEMNRITAVGQDFGFPYLHGKAVKDPDLKAPKGFRPTAPAWEFKAHNAPLGMRFGRQGPLKGDILACLHGSWNRSKKDGYKVVRLKLKGGKVLGQEDFLTGFLDGERTLGRPVDVLQRPDGSWLVSDDDMGAVYRVYRP